MAPEMLKLIEQRRKNKRNEIETTEKNKTKDKRDLGKVVGRSMQRNRRIWWKIWQFQCAQENQGINKWKVYIRGFLDDNRQT